MVSDSFSQKMPTNVALWLVPEDDSAVYSMVIHTSCSKPFIGYGQAFGQGCDGSDSSLVDLFDEDQVSDNSIYIAFLDGFSAGYFTALQDCDDSSLSFDISFSGCGCQCNTTKGTISPSFEASSSPTSSPSASPYAFPSTTPSNEDTLGFSDSPTTHPSGLQSVRPSQSLEPTAPRPLGPQARPASVSPSDKPTIVNSDFPTLETVQPSQSLEPTVPRPLGPQATPTSVSPSHGPTFAFTENPTFGPSTNDDCSLQCEAWIFENCILVGDDGTPLGVGCDISFSVDLDGGRLLDVSGMDEIAYHEEMIAKLLDMLG